MLLTQLLVLQPLGLLVLDLTTARTGDSASRRRRVLVRRSAGGPQSAARRLTARPAACPILALPLPPLVNEPLNLIAGMAVPAMLLAYGVSLRLGPLPGAGEPPIQIATIVALKLVVQPLAAYLIARYALGPAGTGGLRGHRHRRLAHRSERVHPSRCATTRGVILARDTIFCSTILSVPVIVALTALLT